METEPLNRAWVLNLAAEVELERGHAPLSGRAQDALERHVAVVAASLLAPGDVLVGRDPIPPGITGVCWCPTPGALAKLREAGAREPSAPDVAILRAVNDRAFCAAMGQTLKGARYVSDMSAFGVLEAGRWRLKRAFGFAGRGRRTVRAPLTPLDLDWLRSAFRSGGVQVEPEVTILREAASHGSVSPGGQVHLHPATVQTCLAGAWTGSRVATPGELPGALDREGGRVGAALHRAGYFGPFGVDAYEYLDDGVARWNLRSEINARYTMAWRRQEAGEQEMRSS